ncbi:TonB-dependent receptor [Brevundimonas vancanneytii]|uniref:TonB-dependent receptor n=1 Tax=Brevundimonas vancanneytii TaxID=1325724 RepID=UPI00209592BF|nr:TonB-dependent receptor [Brevundimonas vancanneytii]
MFGGETTYKLGLNWTVVDSLRLRATYGTGFRIPSVPELFGGVAEGNLTVRRQRLWHRSGVADNGGIGSRRSDVRNADETQSLQPKIGCQAHQEARRGGGERYSPCHTPAFLGRG